MVNFRETLKEYLESGLNLAFLFDQRSQKVELNDTKIKISDLSGFVDDLSWDLCSINDSMVNLGGYLEVKEEKVIPQLKFGISNLKLQKEELNFHLTGMGVLKTTV